MSLPLRCTAVAAATLLAGCGHDEKAPRENAGRENLDPAVQADGESPAGVADGEAHELTKIPTLQDRSGDAPLASVFAKAEPSADDVWRSEQLGQYISKTLKRVGETLSAADWSGDAFAALLADDAASTPLRPEGLATVYSDKALTVRRGEPGAELRPDLRAELRALRAPYAIDGELRVKFKLIGVSPGDGGDDLVGSKAVLETVGDGVGDGERINQSALWECRWRIDPQDPEHPRLVELRCLEFEEVVARGALFADATGGLLGDQPSYTEQLSHGADYWYGNLDVSFGIHQGNQGLAVGDADGDGLDDLFVCQPAGLPSRLFLREPDGSLRDATAEAGLDWLDTARSVLFVDLDNDADQDLLLSLNYSLVVFENEGAARFTRRVMIDIHSWPSSIAAADYDLDGDLDVYICGYNPRGETAPGDIFANPVPFHDANNGARNFFIENLGGFDFADRTAEVGFTQNNNRFSFAASWEDYDDDGDPDLYVANDFGRNSLYRNDLEEDGGRRFRDVAAEAGVEDIAAGMSVCWGDYDGDGRIDLYTSNMFSAAGSRVTTQEQFKRGLDAGTRSSFRRHARGNTLYRNLGDGRFEDVSEGCGVTLGRWAWGSQFADFNNDGWQDLYVANGFFTTPDTGDL